MKDLGGLMKQAQELQSKMADMQASLSELEVQGISGGGLVTVTLTGKGVLTGLVIDGSLMKEDEREILEDLIVAAHAEARTKMEQAVAEKMKEVTGGLPLPPGMNLGL
ncbi:MAG: YbaB/EbfC family nucleoid-associated protein [Hyphomicrobiales bacterium]